MTGYSVRHNYSSPARVDELLRDFTYLSGSLNALARHTMETLKNIYDVHTVSEWMEQKLLPLFEFSFTDPYLNLAFATSSFLMGSWGISYSKP